MAIGENSIYWMWYQSIIISIYLISFAISVEIIPYEFHSDNDESINKCLLRAMEIITDKTCLLFEPKADVTIDIQTKPILFVQSPLCSWQKSNQTMHLNAKCLNELSPSLPSSSLSTLSSPWSDDACLAVLSHTLYVTTSSEPAHTQVTHLINTMYNCTAILFKLIITVVAVVVIVVVIVVVVVVVVVILVMLNDRSSECFTEVIIGQKLRNDYIIKACGSSLSIYKLYIERCNIECENGGTVNMDCSCHCAYGFEGKNCEQLSRRKLFTDPSCGTHNDEQGTISLSTYPETRTGATFCQWLIKSSPDKTIEFYIKDLDLDDDNVPPDQPCNDIFYIWGTRSISNPILCITRDNLIGVRFESDSNWLLVELRTNPWSERSHRGPRIKYRQVDAPYQRSLRTFTNDIVLSNAASNVSVFIVTLLLALIG